MEVVLHTTFLADLRLYIQSLFTAKIESADNLKNASTPGKRGFFRQSEINEYLYFYTIIPFIY